MDTTQIKLSLFGDRLRSACSDNGISASELAVKTGISANTISAYMNGKQWPNAEKSLLLQSALEVSLDWLLAGESQNAPQWSDNYIEVPLYETTLSGGHGNEVISESPVSRLSFKRTWFVGQKQLDPKHAALMFVKGDSMEPTFYDGDLVLINLNNRDINGGGIYAVRWENRLMVKRLSWAAPDRLRVASDNERFYPPIEVDASDGVEVLGEIVWYCRDLRK